MKVFCIPQISLADEAAHQEMAQTSHQNLGFLLILLKRVV